MLERLPNVRILSATSSTGRGTCCGKFPTAARGEPTQSVTEDKTEEITEECKKNFPEAIATFALEPSPATIGEEVFDELKEKNEDETGVPAVAAEEAQDEEESKIKQIPSRGALAPLVAPDMAPAVAAPETAHN